MPFVSIPIDGRMVHAHIKMDKPRRQRCQFCNELTRDMRLCDWKMPAPQDTPADKWPTCDAKCCPRCATHPAPDKDICPGHREALAEWVMAERLEVAEAAP